MRLLNGNNAEEAMQKRDKQFDTSLTMKNLRRLPIVGDVHLGRESWPSTQEDWENIFSIKPLPIKLCKIAYSVNEREKAFNAIRIHFKNQEFESYELQATERRKRLVS